MATTKYLDKAGLQKFYELIDAKYVATNELNEDKGIAWAVSNQDDVTNNSADPVYKAEVKLGTGLEFDDDGAITAEGLSAATDTKLGTIKTFVNTYDEDDNPTGNNVGIQMVASDPDNAPTVLDRATIVGVEAIINKGAASGYCPLDANSLVPVEYLPSYVDDTKEGYMDEENGKFYSDRTVDDTDPDNVEITYDTDDEIEGETDKIYVDIATSKVYRWSGSVFVEITSGPVSPIPDSEIEALFA